MRCKIMERKLPERILIDNIEVNITKEDVLKKMGMPADHRFGDAIAEVIEEAKNLGNAKLLYCEAKIGERTEETIEIGGVTFTGKDLVDALKDVDTVYPYICTCGAELYDATLNSKDLVRMFYLDNIAHFYLLQPSIVLSDILDNKFGTRSECMTPGSFENWELSQNVPIFTLLNNGEGTGVTMNEFALMDPAKSVAGIRFKTTDCGKKCSICMKRDCADRVDDFGKTIYEDTLC